ncbi:Nramp family divalent metal transporter [Henriciella sp.]|uniref:Nramp family divalent metal transporter n=1 Tax=Henriciella sp. TaxID=1968823 RepID=UPI0026293426|nr:Nramp family divalent metal transporter [Henriciella sp.]
MTQRKTRFQTGPGTLVAAAFIGPGTVTTCTLAGAQFGFSLVWALVFATAATMILQDMSARLGAGARLGLGEALVKSAPGSIATVLAGGLILLALAIGNAAYESGNILGGVLGVEALTGEGARKALVLVIALIASAILLIGQYKPMERILVGLVLIMAAAFALSAVIVRPDPGALLSGLSPKIPEGGLLMTIALIGTTIVPYNLFLHAAGARQRWRKDAASVTEARRESAISIGIGGIVSILILSTAASSLFVMGIDVQSAQDMALAIEPAFGPPARYLVGAGLLAAGLTSAVTAPMATAFALNELFPPRDEKHGITRFRLFALSIVAVGTAIALTDINAVALIITAQTANGFLLPIIAIMLLLIMNRGMLLNEHANGMLANIAGGLVVAIAVALGGRGIWLAIERGLSLI